MYPYHGESIERIIMDKKSIYLHNRNGLILCFIFRFIEEM